MKICNRHYYVIYAAFRMRGVAAFSAAEQKSREAPADVLLDDPMFLQTSDTEALRLFSTHYDKALSAEQCSWCQIDASPVDAGGPRKLIAVDFLVGWVDACVKSFRKYGMLPKLS